MKSIAVGSDHAGFKMKETLLKVLEFQGYQVIDYGTNSEEPCDYPEYAYKIASAVAKKQQEVGLLICGTGLGQDMVANKMPGIRAALCVNTLMAQMSRSHNDANVLILPSRVIAFELAIDILITWMDTPFSHEERHIRRIAQIKEIEKKIADERSSL